MTRLVIFTATTLLSAKRGAVSLPLPLSSDKMRAEGRVRRQEESRAEAQDDEGGVRGRGGRRGDKETKRTAGWVGRTCDCR